MVTVTLKTARGGSSAGAGVAKVKQSHACDVDNDTTSSNAAKQHYRGSSVSVRSFTASYTVYSFCLHFSVLNLPVKRWSKPKQDRRQEVMLVLDGYCWLMFLHMKGQINYLTVLLMYTDVYKKQKS